MFIKFNTQVAGYGRSVRRSVDLNKCGKNDKIVVLGRSVRRSVD